MLGCNSIEPNSATVAFRAFFVVLGSIELLTLDGSEDLTTCRHGRWR